MPEVTQPNRAIRRAMASRSGPKSGGRLRLAKGQASLSTAGFRQFQPGRRLGDDDREWREVPEEPT